MGFILEGLDAERYDRAYRDRQLIARITAYFRPKLPIIIITAILVVLNSALDTAFPLLVSQSINTLLLSNVLQTVLWLVGIILLATLLSWFANMFRQWFTARTVGDVALQLRRDAFAAAMKQDMSFFDEFSSGKIASRVTADTDSFANVVMLTINLLSQTLLFFLIMGVLFISSFQLALLTLLMVPAIIAVAIGFRRISRTLSRRSQRSLARVNASVQEVTSGITVAKNFRQERNMYDEFRLVNEQSYQVNVRLGFLYNCIFPILVTIANLGTVLIVYFGGQDILDHHISPGAWYLFLQAISILWVALTSIASFWSQFQLGLSASERVFALLDAEAHVLQTDHKPVPPLAGNIEFKNTSFQYNDRQTVLTDFHLTIKAGETIALVGHTGAGKSSIGKLIARFYEFQSGQILIDGEDIRSFDLHDYRRHLGIIAQVPFLFSGTVADNIRYARPEAATDEVARVAACIGGGDWLESLPEGLDTLVGETGKALSMGQRQLVALARVLLQDSAIVILDEATASVDPLTEAQIQEGLDIVLKDRTAIVIAHRLSTIRHADSILVLDRGRIVEEGNHEALLACAGYYAHLYNSYFRHQSSDYKPGEGFVPVSIRAASLNNAS